MIRLGLLGCGGIARAHVQAIQELADRCHLVVQFDSNPEQMQAVQALYPAVESAAAIEDFWAVPMDAVLIAVPNRDHALYVHAAAERGLAIFCEKPLANSTAEAQHMVEAVNRAGVTNMIGFKNRFVPAIEQLHRLLQSQGLGDIFAYREVCSGARLVDPEIGLEWRMQAHWAGGGAVADFGSHSLDMATWLLGPYVGALESLSARLATFVLRHGVYPSNDDMALLDGRFASGALLSVLNSRVGPGRYEVEVYGARGFATVDMNQPEGMRVTFYRPDQATSIPPVSASRSTPWVRQLTVFLEAVERGEAVEPSFETGLAVQRWIDGARIQAH